MTQLIPDDVERFVGDGGDLPDRPPPDGLTDDRLVAILESIAFLRTFDERAVALQRQGRIGTYPPFWGEEGTQAGAFHALADGDWIFPSYRQSAIGILRGVRPSKIYKYRRGYGGEHGFWIAREHRVAPMTVAIGTQIPHAVGLAWAAKTKGENVASLVFFGDGATSEGDFHEAMNFAAVFKTPTIFFCTNNQWAISTPVSRQMATATVAEKADAYGMPGVRIDGFDPLACWKATSDARARAEAGDGPTLIEAFCYRLAPHGTADDPGRYRDEGLTEEWRRLEPLGRFADYLIRGGVLDRSGVDAILAGAKERIAEAVVELEEGDAPPPDVLFEHVYAGPDPWTFAAARQELGDASGAP
ncbi:MAG TPA: thiamine pyrophosphate-dependent enzyme [Actinomycetota bacterium]|nr:thiamine pyrophosphate-dependent enzyme [Actinomycetota bacterium]